MNEDDVDIITAAAVLYKNMPNLELPVFTNWHRNITSNQGVH